MRSIFLCISISLIANTFISANQQDSLLQLLDQTEEPISKIDYYLGLARLNMLSTGDHHLALEYARKAYQEAEDISSLKYQAISQNFIGMLYYNLSLPYEEALQKAESLAEKSGDPDAIAFTKYAIIEVSEYDFERGIKELEDVILKHGHQINQRNLGNVYKVLSWQYEQNGDLEEAEAANLNAIEILSEHAADLPIDPDLKRVSSLNYDGGLENLFQVHVYNGDLYVKMGRINDAIEMGKKAETIANQLNNKPGFAYLYTKQGRYYREAGEYEKAIQKFKQSIEIHKDLNEPTYEAGSLSELTGLYITLKEWDLAENSIKRTIQLTKEVPDDQAEYFNQYAYILMSKGQSERAVEKLMEANAIHKKNGKRHKIIETSIQIAEIRLASNLRDGLEEELIVFIPELRKTSNYILLYKLYNALSMNAELDNDLDLSLNFAQEGLNIIENNIDNKELQNIGYIRLAYLEQLRKNYREALDYHLKAKRIQDSLYSQNAIAMVKAEQVKQNVDQYKEESKIANERASLLRRQNQLAIVTAVSLLGLLLTGLYFFIQLRKTRKQLEFQNQELKKLNATKDRFFGIIAHDIRSPIVALESVDQQMKFYMKKGDEDKVKKLSTLVGTTTRKLNGLLDNLLNWALAQTDMVPYHPENILLSSVLEESLDLFNASISQKQLKIRAEIEDIQLYADQKAVSTIVRNLLSNAIKFSNINDEISIKGKVENKKAFIEITDNGVGMTSDQVSDLFEIGKKSKTGTAGEKGTGLGLILVKELTEVNKGGLEVDSTPGKGSTFRFSLPLAS